MGRARWPRIANCFKRREEREMVKQSIINRVREVDFSSKHTRYKRVPQVLNVLLFLLKKWILPCASLRESKLSPFWWLRQLSVLLPRHRMENSSQHVANRILRSPPSCHPNLP